MRTNVKIRKAVWESGYVSPSVFGVRANNITFMTITGTNTFIVHTPGTAKALVVDPGPADVAHLRNVMTACANRGAKIAGILLTHHHIDHVEGADLLRFMVANGPDSIDPEHIPAALDGQRFMFDDDGTYPIVTFPEEGIPVYHVELGNLPAGPFEPFEGCPRMEIVPLPGHSYDMVGVLVNDEKLILTSDLIFRYWPVIIPLNDGDLRDYLDSLSVLQRLVRSGKAEQFIPAHGFPIDQPIKALEGNRAHHRKRIEEVRNAVDAGAGYDPEAVVQAIYGDIADPIHLLSSINNAAMQLKYIAEERGVEFNYSLKGLGRKFSNLSQ